VLFEREGARAESPRDFYLRKLQDSHVVIGIYRNSYGWIDEPKGMQLSGVEDEFREARRQGKDFLAYVLKDAADRDPRLSGIVDEILGGPNVVYLFNDGEDLETRVRDDLTALISDRVASAQAPSTVAGSASKVLEAIFRGGALRAHHCQSDKHLAQRQSTPSRKMAARCQFRSFLARRNSRPAVQTMAVTRSSTNRARVRRRPRY